MMTTEQLERMAFEKMAVEKLTEFVNETISSMADSTRLQPNEALDILENIQVEMVGELKSAIEVLEDDVNNEPVRRVGSHMLSLEIEKAINAISFATDLDTEEITTIFSDKPGAGVADVAYRLHVQSAHDRARF